MFRTRNKVLGLERHEGKFKGQNYPLKQLDLNFMKNMSCCVVYILSMLGVLGIGCSGCDCLLVQVKSIKPLTISMSNSNEDA